MSKIPKEIFILETLPDHPLFEGFTHESTSTPSLIGRKNLREDMEPGFEVSEQLREWSVPLLSKVWQPPNVEGKVAPFNDYPGINMIFPAFSQRACDILAEFLLPNGELLPLKTDIGQYYFFNITKVVDALDIKNSSCEFWCNPPTTAIDIEYFEFKKNAIIGLSIFRIYEEPFYTLVTDQFVEKVTENGLNGFDFKKIWPLPKGSNWRAYDKEMKTNFYRNIHQLKKNTYIIILIPESAKLSSKDKKQIKIFEREVDALLTFSNINSTYFGRYEASDVVENKYRMFISCPDISSLEIKLAPWLKSLEWSGSIQIIKKYGEVYDEQARSEIFKYK